MERTTDLAIVLKTIAYSERSRIVTGLTLENGVISAMARNSIQSRRFGGGLDLFCASQWTLSKRSNDTFFQLRETLVKETYSGIRKSFEQLTIASLFNEIVLKLTPAEQNCPELFQLHSNALWAVAQAKPEGYLPLLNAYFAKTLQWHGCQPKTHECQSCHRSLNEFSDQELLHPDIPAAAWRCPSCSQATHNRMDSFLAKTTRIQVRVMKQLYQFLRAPIRKAEETVYIQNKEQDILFQFLENLMTFHIAGYDHHLFKSFRFSDLGSTPQHPASLPQ